MPARIAVIIPYFQRTPGLLTAALVSVFAQSNAADIVAIVVDDGSPVPADQELAAVDPLLRPRVRVIVQPNQGVARARNVALDAVPEGTEYVA